MQCVREYIVQDAEEGNFLAPDGEGGILLVRMLSRAVPFPSEEAAQAVDAAIVAAVWSRSHRATPRRRWL